MSSSASRINAAERVFLCLDVGEKRTGLAIGNSIARIASPLETINRDNNFFSRLKKIVAEQQVNVIVVGLPRNLDGNETPQTAETKKFVQELKKNIDIKIDWQDETLSTVEAKKLLDSKNKPYDKELVDAVAAALILEDYLTEL